MANTLTQVLAKQQAQIARSVPMGRIPTPRLTLGSVQQPSVQFARSIIMESTHQVSKLCVVDVRCAPLARPQQAFYVPAIVSL
jgi:hypothetical protein